MKKKLLAAIIIAAGILTGCGDENNTQSVIDLNPTTTSAPSNVSEPQTTEAPQQSEQPPEAVLGNGMFAGGENHPIEERTIVNGQMQSYLTGEWKDADVVQRRNMAVMIPNNPPAMPQYGISLASIIYEAPVEGRITRLMGIFEDYDDLDKIGPIRSSRDYYVYEAMAYDSIYVNWGLAIPYVAPVINTDRIDNISQAVSGIEVASPGAFDRVSRPGYKTEFTGYMFIDGYEKAVTRLKYATTYKEHGRFVQAFTFADEGYIATYEDYPDATIIRPGGTTSNSGGYSSNKARFEYNEEDGLYYRYQYDDAQIDEYNNEQLAVTNVILKICHGEVRDDHDYLAFGVHGSGDAYVFTNGKVIEATWQRNSDYEPNLFFDKNGNEIIFNQGKTWICCIWDDYKYYIYYE